VSLGSGAGDGAYHGGPATHPRTDIESLPGKHAAGGVKPCAAGVPAAVPV